MVIYKLSCFIVIKTPSFLMENRYYKPYKSFLIIITYNVSKQFIYTYNVSKKEQNNTYNVSIIKHKLNKSNKKPTPKMNAIRIRNFSTGEIIADNARFIRGFAKGIGLRFALKPRALIFEFSSPVRPVVDMFFVFFPIDIIFLDKHRKVVELKESLRPFSAYFTKRNITYFIELPAGTIKRTRTRLGNRIAF